MTDHWRLVNGTELYDIRIDPGQSNNIAGSNPAVVEELREAYEEWWADVSERFDEYCEIIIGSAKENPSRLTCHDWHSVGGVRQAQSSQGAVREGAQVSGFWAVEIERDGTYQFELRRWPKELDAPINAAVPGGKAISATSARLKISDLDVSKAIPNGAHAVTFKVELKAGKKHLQTWLTSDGGASWGAYYVYVRRL